MTTDTNAPFRTCATRRILAVAAASADVSSIDDVSDVVVAAVA